MSNTEQQVDLSFFMPGKAAEVEEFTAPISKRFKDKDGNVIPFKFKPITTERVDELEKTSMKNVVKNNKVVGKELDNSRFMARIAVESTTYPDFKASEMRKAYKTEDPVEIAKKVLHVAGEYANWIAKAAEINGFEDDLDDLEEIAKN
ncbi:phage portal protein [Lentibacillus sp. N15]|uniref:phage tail assembly chaperone n=1 Tax=Lentibacillus songyuanensis TaxID=3136161 RepID=UPI0031BB0319